MDESRSSTRQWGWWLQGMLCGLGIVLAIAGCSALVLVGILSGWSGASAVILAAIVPLAGLVWAVLLSVLHPTPPAQPLPRPDDRAADLVGPDRWYA